jgi:HEAT repeat protein
MSDALLEQKRKLAGVLSALCDGFRFRWGRPASRGDADAELSVSPVRYRGGLAHLIAVTPRWGWREAVRGCPWAIRTDSGELVRTGHTDSRGQTLLTDLPDGEFQIEIEVLCPQPLVERQRGTGVKAVSRTGQRVARAEVERLTRALFEPDASGRKGAEQPFEHLFDLHQREPALARALEQTLIRALGSADPNVRVRAVNAAGQMGRAVAQAGQRWSDRSLAGACLAVPALASALADPDPSVGATAATALGGISPAAAWAVSDLVSALTALAPNVRAGAAEALGGIGSAAAGAVPALVSALADADPTVRACSAGALGRIGPAASGAVSALASTLADADKRVREDAARALGRIGPGASGAVPTLASALADPDPDLRARAAEALGDIGPVVAGAVLTLTRALADPAADVRASAAQALGRCGPAATPLILPLLADADPNVRARVAVTLGRIGPAAAGAVPALTSALADPDLSVQVCAAEALGNTGPVAVEAVPVLGKLFRDAPPRLAVALSRALLRVGKQAVPGLLPLLTEGPRLARVHIVKALRDIGRNAAEVLPALSQLRNDPDLLFRAVVNEALERISSREPPPDASGQAEQSPKAPGAAQAATIWEALAAHEATDQPRQELYSPDGAVRSCVLELTSEGSLMLTAEVRPDTPLWGGASLARCRIWTCDGLPLSQVYLALRRGRGQINLDAFRREWPDGAPGGCLIRLDPARAFTPFDRADLERSFVATGEAEDHAALTAALQEALRPLPVAASA